MYIAYNSQTEIKQGAMVKLIAPVTVILPLL